MLKSLRKGLSVKVSELIAELKEYPQDSMVVLSRDAEGNGFRVVDELSEGFFYEGEMLDLVDEEGNEREADSGMAPAVCIWPLW